MSKQRILFVYNTGEYLLRLRRELLVELINSGHEVFALFPFDDATPALEKLGVRCVDLAMTPHSVAPWRELVTLFDVRKKLRLLRPDTVFAFTIKPIVYSGLSLRRSDSPRLFVMITGLGMMFAGNGVKGWCTRRLATMLYRRTLSRAAVVFMQNKEHGDTFLRRRLITPSQYQLIAGSGVNLQSFSQQPVAETDRPVFLLVTRMLEHKGVREFIVAATQFAGRGGSAEFLLAGPVVQGPHAISKSELDRLLAEAPVRYVGAVNDVPALLARATIVVLPSVYPEGVPRILLEALAVGRPIITTDTPGCRSTVSFPVPGSCNNSADNPVIYAPEEAAPTITVTTRAAAKAPSTSAVTEAGDNGDGSMSDIHGKAGLNGVLFDPAVPHALLNCMEWMASLSSQRLNRMGNAGRELAQRRFDVNEVNKEITGRLLEHGNEL